MYQHPIANVVCANIGDIASRIFAACDGCQASDLKLSSVSQCCFLSLAGPPVAHLCVFFVSSQYVNLFLLFTLHKLGTLQST